MTDSYVAHWSRADSNRVVIIDAEGKTVDCFGAAPDGDRPSENAFCGAVWAPFPGCEWEEEPPGRWSVAVFRERVGKAEGARGMSKLRDQRRPSIPGGREPEFGWLWWAARSPGRGLAS
jgi:hypothetical protein